MKESSKDNLNTAVTKTVSVALCLAGAFSIFVYAVYQYNTKGEFLSAIKSFYFPALLLLFAGSLLYTPLSFGVSLYFIKAGEGGGSFSDVFFLFRSPGLLFKAVVLTVMRRTITELLRLLVLAVALILECAVFVICITLSGENIFDYEKDFLQNAASFMTRNDFFAVFTLASWMCVIFLMFLIKIKYILCKYALIENYRLGIFEALRVGLFCSRGKLFEIAAFYIKYLTLYILLFLRIQKKKSVGFSTYAIELVRKRLPEYFEC